MVILHVEPIISIGKFMVRFSVQKGSEQSGISLCGCYPLANYASDQKRSYLGKTFRKGLPPLGDLPAIGPTCGSCGSVSNLVESRKVTLARQDFRLGMLKHLAKIIPQTPQ